MISNSIKKIEYRYVVAAIYACILFLDRLDLTIVNIALPTIAFYFKVPITKTEWITNGFLLALAISIPISGWAGDRFGIKKVFILSTVFFGLSSLLCAFSPNLSTMIVSRFIQGISGGMIIPVGMSMVYSVFDHSEYASITSYIFLPTLIAPALAPSLGGMIIYFSSWKWIFIFSAPICFIVATLSIQILKKDEIKSPPLLDWGGFVLATCSLVLILYFISILEKNGLNAQVFAVLIAMIISVTCFLKYEKVNPFPLFDIKFFKNKLFLQINLIQLAFQICHFGSIFLIGMYLQIGVGMSAMAGGLIMGMQAIGAMCTSRYSVKLFNQFGPGIPIVIGFIGVAIFTLLILTIDQPDKVLLGSSILFIRGIFSGLCGTPIQTASIIGFKKNEVSRASAIFNAGRQVSISLGVALSSMLIAYGFKSNGVDFIQPIKETGGSVFYYAFAMIPLISIMGIIITLTIDNENVLLISYSRK